MTMCDCDVSDRELRSNRVEEAYAEPEGPLRQAELHQGGAIAIIHLAPSKGGFAGHKVHGATCKILVKPFPVNGSGACAIVKFDHEHVPALDHLKNYTVNVQ